MIRRAWIVVKIVVKRNLKRELQEVIKNYEQSFISRAPVDPQKTIDCHKAKLVVEDDPEARLRSIQTLADLGEAGHSRALSAALTTCQKEITSVSQRWPYPATEHITCRLSETWQKSMVCCSASPPAAAKTNSEPPLPYFGWDGE